MLFIKLLLSYLISQPRKIRTSNAGRGHLIVVIRTASKSDSLTLREKTTYFKNKQQIQLIHSVVMDIHNKDVNYK